MGDGVYVIHIVIQVCSNDYVATSVAMKKFFLNLTVHSVHLIFLFINIKWLYGYGLVKSEQSSVHNLSILSSNLDVEMRLETLMLSNKPIQ